MESKIVELVEFIIKKLAQYPEKLTFTSVEDGNNFVITVRATQEDMGRIIGKQGRIVKSIRNIVKAASVGQEGKYFVEIKDLEEA